MEARASFLCSSPGPLPLHSPSDLDARPVILSLWDDRRACALAST